MYNSGILFSVIIPTYNRGDKLVNCLRSLLNQTYKDFEVIVCDDGSMDHTADVIKMFVNKGLEIRYFFNENWGGPAHPRNIGIAEAKAPWICFLDSDDVWYSNKLEKCERYINEYDLICHDFDIQMKDNRTKRHKITRFKGDVFEELLTKGNSIITSSVCIRRNILVDFGGFSEDRLLIAVEDFDLWLRVARAGFRFKVIHESLGSYWNGGGNISANSNDQVERLRLVYNKHVCFLTNSKKECKQVTGILDYQIGRIKQDLSEYSEAVKCYVSAIQSGRIMVKFKSFFFLLSCLFKLHIDK